MMKTKLTLFVSVLAVALFGVGCSSLNKGLVAYYPFNGNLLDESGNDNHGKPKGEVSLATDRFGQVKKAHKFSGGYIHVDSHPSLQATDRLTLSVWVKDPSGLPATISKWGGGFGQFAVHKGPQSYCLYVDIVKGGGFGFFLNDGKRNLTNVREWKIGDKTKWNHVLATYDGEYAKVYVNGTMKAQNSCDNSKIDVNDWPVWIGNDGYDNIYKGLMDDVRIYNRALSAQEVIALYDLEKPKTK